MSDLEDRIDDEMLKEYKKEESPKMKKERFKKFLKSLNLSKFFQTFIDEGYQSIEDFLEFQVFFKIPYIIFYFPFFSFFVLFVLLFCFCVCVKKQKKQKRMLN